MGNIKTWKYTVQFLVVSAETNMNAKNKQINNWQQQSVINASYLCDFKALTGSLASSWCGVFLMEFKHEMRYARDFIGMTPCC